MLRLLGEYDCKVDAKGRIRLPSGLISQLDEGESLSFVINRGFDKCLMVYPQKVWEKIAQEIDNLNMYDKKNRDFVRYFYRGAHKVELDSADRMLITKRLLEYASIEKEVILYAYKDRVEVWSKEKYMEMLDKEPDSFSDLAQEVLGGDNTIEN